MNYIKRMEKENKEKENEIKSVKATVQELMTYLQSSKFYSGDSELNGYVSIQDVMNRLQTIR